MASTTEYLRQTSFTDAQAADPTAPLSGPGVDAELNRVKLALDSTQQSLDLIQRDDGALANGIVTADSLSPGLLAGITPATQWSIGVNYAVYDSVFVDDEDSIKLYRCLTAHTSAAAFADDLAAGLWIELADFTPPEVVGTIAVANGGTGATSAADARTNLGLGAVATENVVPVTAGGTGADNAADARTGLGLAIGSQIQGYSADLGAIAALPLGNNELWTYHTGGYQRMTISSFYRGVLVATDAAAARTAIGATATGSSLLTTASASAARTTLGATATGSSLFTAASALAARTAIGASAGWGDPVVIYDQADDGTVSSVASDNFEDGYEYLFIINRLRSTATSSLRVAVYRETSGSYSSPVVISGAAVANTFQYLADVRVPLPRISKRFHVVDANVFSSDSSSTDTETASIPDAFSGFTHATAQKLRNVRFTFSAGDINFGDVTQYRRRAGA